MCHTSTAARTRLEAIGWSFQRVAASDVIHSADIDATLRVPSCNLDDIADNATSQVSAFETSREDTTSHATWMQPDAGLQATRRSVRTTFADAAFAYACVRGEYCKWIWRMAAFCRHTWRWPNIIEAVLCARCCAPVDFCRRIKWASGNKNVEPSCGVERTRLLTVSAQLWKVPETNDS